MAKKTIKKKNSNNQYYLLLLVAVVAIIIFNNQSTVNEEPPLVEEETTTTPSYTGGGGGGGGGSNPPPVVVYDWCYQESPTVENQTGIDGNCGLLYLGSFSSGNESFWINYSNLNDGNWSTYAYANESVLPWAEINIVYEKPPGALPNSLFQHRHDNFIGDINDPETIDFMQIPISCWDYNEDYLVFTAVSRTNTTEAGFRYSAFHCYNGTHYPTLTSLTLDAFIYEDAMWWAFPEGYLEQYDNPD